MTRSGAGMPRPKARPSDIILVSRLTDDSLPHLPQSDPRPRLARPRDLEVGHLPQPLHEEPHRLRLWAATGPFRFLPLWDLGREKPSRHVVSGSDNVRGVGRGSRLCKAEAQARWRLGPLEVAPDPSEEGSPAVFLPAKAAASRPYRTLQAGDGLLSGVEGI